MNIVKKNLYRVTMAIRQGFDAKLVGDEFLYIVAGSIEDSLTIGRMQVVGKDYEVSGSTQDGVVLMWQPQS